MLANLNEDEDGLLPEDLQQLTKRQFNQAQSAKQ